MRQVVLVCGGRDYSDRERVFSALDLANAANPIATLIHGGARGADSLAHDWARARMVKVRCYNADWQKHSRSAGPIRNQAMLEDGKPHLVIAFPGGRGTADMIRRAKAADVAVLEIES